MARTYFEMLRPRRRATLRGQTLVKLRDEAVNDDHMRA